METPDVEEASAFLVHPGVRAYVNGSLKLEASDTTHARGQTVS